MSFKKTSQRQGPALVQPMIGPIGGHCAQDGPEAATDDVNV